MTKQHGTDQNGQPTDLIGQPLVEGIGSVPGLLFDRESEAHMPANRKYERYHYRGTIIRIFAGDTVPDGAVKVEAPAERAKSAAPENKSRKAAPETKSKD